MDVFAITISQCRKEAALKQHQSLDPPPAPPLSLHKAKLGFHVLGRSCFASKSEGMLVGLANVLALTRGGNKEFLIII